MSRVYIGRLARDTRERDLEDLFKDCGTIREINLKSGYGFVEFKHSQDARDAVYKYHGKSFLGERIIVEIARGTRRSRREDRGRDDRRSRYRVMVENIPEGTSWQDLKDLMRKAGEVTFADIFRSRPGEGVVEFAHRSDMEYALRRLDGAELKGSKVKLFEDSRRSSRRSRSRSVSRSRSPPRHRSSRRRSPSYSRSRSRSRSPRRRGGRSSRREEDLDMRDRSPADKRSRSASHRAKSRSPVRSRSRSPAPSRSRSPTGGERSRTPSRSRSRSPARNGYSDAE